MISVVGPPQFLLHPVSDLRSGGELEMEMICQFALFPAAPLIFSNLHISKCLICKNLKHSHHLKHGGFRVVGHWYFVIFWPIAQMLLRCWMEGNMNQLMVNDFMNAMYCSSIPQVQHSKWLVWFRNPLSAGSDFSQVGFGPCLTQVSRSLTHCSALRICLKFEWFDPCGLGYLTKHFDASWWWSREVG